MISIIPSELQYVLSSEEQQALQQEAAVLALREAPLHSVKHPESRLAKVPPFEDFLSEVPPSGETSCEGWTSYGMLVPGKKV